MVEGIENYKDLSKSKRRELVNKYPLFVAWYCAVRLELILKTVVVPLYGASCYVVVFEWSPYGGMVHLHYILWKRGAPRFDLHAQELQDKATTLRKAGLIAGGEVTCDIKYFVDFFADYITEWNPNKSAQGEEKRATWPRKSMRPSHTPHRSVHRRCLICCEQRVLTHDTNTTSEQCVLSTCTIFIIQTQQAHRIQPNHVRSFSKEL